MGRADMVDGGNEAPVLIDNLYGCGAWCGLSFAYEMWYDPSTELLSHFRLCLVTTFWFFFVPAQAVYLRILYFASDYSAKAVKSDPIGFHCTE